MVNVRMCFLMVYLYRLFFRLQLEGLAMDFHCLICSFQVSLSLSLILFLYISSNFVSFALGLNLVKPCTAARGSFCTPLHASTRPGFKD